VTAKWIAVLAVAGLGALPGPAHAAGLFSSLDGAWKGSGEVRLDSGTRERITCKGYYNAKSGGAELGVAISCANAAVKITMRAQLVDSGGKVSGTWEEREFNQSGEVTGKATDDTLSLTFAGGLTGKMSIASSGSSQTVQITTGGPGFVGANLELKK
jgi:hypothetical protein